MQGLPSSAASSTPLCRLGIILNDKWNENGLSWRFRTGAGPRPRTAAAQGVGNAVGQICLMT
jgi:hypothetical protein